MMFFFSGRDEGEIESRPGDLIKLGEESHAR